jgi:hypothetical protein
LGLGAASAAAQYVVSHPQPSHNPVNLDLLLDPLSKNEFLSFFILEFALMCLKLRIANWGVLYIAGHFLPYYGIYPITNGKEYVRTFAKLLQ